MTCNDWVAGIEFLCKTSQERAQSTTAHNKKNINNLHVELGQPLEVITNATTKSMGIQLTISFKLCEGCAVERATKGRVCKKAIACSKILGERLFTDISSPSTPTFGGKECRRQYQLCMEFVSKMKIGFSGCNDGPS